MSEFNVKVNKVKPAVSELQGEARNVAAVCATVMEINNNLAFRVASSANVKQRLKAVTDSMAEESRRLNVMGTSLSNILNAYDSTDKKVAGKTILPSIDPNVIIEQIKEAMQSGVNKTDNYLADGIYKSLIAAAGPVGLIIDGLRRGSEGKWGKVGSDVFKFVGGLAKNVSGSGIKWKDWFGVGKLTKSAAEYGLGKYTDFSSLGKGISSACNWAAAIVSSGYDNYKEFGNFGARFWEETASETLLTVGEGILVSAGVAAAFAAAGVTAPVLAVGATVAGVTVAVDYGLDKLFEWASGGTQTKWKEAVTDFWCDAGEKAVDWVVDTGGKIGNAISEGVNGLKNTVSNIGGNLCKWGSMIFG